jgi:SAM-dependent methyltransferase
MGVSDKVVNGGLKVAIKLRKIRMNKVMLRIAACFIDYEAESLPPDSRVIEYGFALSKIVQMPKGKSLDVGCIARHNYLIPTMCFAGWDVHGIDIRSGWGYTHPNFHFVTGDIRESSYKNNDFDLISCISTIEHIGTTNYYGDTKLEDNADCKVVQELQRILKPSGILIITVPYRKVGEPRPGYKIYDKSLMTMFDSMDIVDEVIYKQDKVKGWIPANRELDVEGVICLALVKKQ